MGTINELDATLNYLKKMLLEEETDENGSLYPEDSFLQAMEKPFYDILGIQYPRTQLESPVSNLPGSYCNSTNWILRPNLNSTSTSMVGDFQISEFNRGVEEGRKFLPKINELVTVFQSNSISTPSLPEENGDSKEYKEGDEGFMIQRSKGKNKSNDSGSDSDSSEGRNRKILMPYFDETIRDATVDEVLFDYDNFKNEVVKLREIMQTKARSSLGKKILIQEELLDIKNLLIHCSRLIATNEHETATEIIKIIRKKSSLDGDATQRLGVLMSNALEARMTGTGSEAYKQLISKKIPISDILKGHILFVTATPFDRASYYFIYQIILNEIQKATKLHIIDFGINYGLQWPSLIQALADRKDRVINLRITGIDFPSPGFRPAELVERTGRRLEDYARSFNVPFKYQGIASKWEAIRIEDLKIEKDEVVIVNSFYRFRQLGDETITLDSPRNQVLNLIRRINPRVFIQGIFNRTFSPFFVTRFKQAMALYSTMCDILEALIPRNELRKMLERDFLARDIMNIVACEGSDWVEKPETFKQWHMRNLRAKFEQLPLDPSIVDGVKNHVKLVYSDDRFLVEEDNNWLLQGWSGNPMYALSVWRAKIA